jgi:rSAM/selenodomain-associated transferase 2
MPATPPLRVSIVVPTLDEEAALDATLATAAAADEIVVSDGGSRDRTLEVARRHGALVVVGTAGRGAQLNRGAAAASGDVLFFLHADTLLPPGAVEAARAAVAGGAAGGAFEVRFDLDAPLYRFGARMINLRSRWTKLGLGDQAQFASRAVFDDMDGFRPWPILEDLDFARRLKRRGRVVIARQAVVTSARRFAGRGAVRTVALNWLLWTLFACGVPPHRLAALYRHAR